jgi:hypothetical protein
MAYKRYVVVKTLGQRTYKKGLTKKGLAKKGLAKTVPERPSSMTNLPTHKPPSTRPKSSTRPT